MTRIRLMPDTLDEANARFAHQRLPQPLFLNSVPKSGTHLLRNILRLFVPLEDHYRTTFIQWGNLFDNLAAFEPERRMLSWGHLLFSDASAVEAARVRKIILVRDPYTWVLARARFFVSEQFGDNAVLVKDSSLPVDALINLMIFGIQGKSMGLRDMYSFNALGWMGAGTTVVRYEDLVEAVKDLDSRRAEAFFADLFTASGIASAPGDWRERVATGADRKQSGTARENLVQVPGIEIPDTLDAQQKALVEFAAPGLRALLGYN